MLALLAGLPRRNAPFRMTLDGEDEVIISSRAHFTFYKDPEFNIERMHPLGGPLGGGTVVHIYLADDALLVDLGGEEHGPECLFTYSEPTATLERTEMRSTRVRANLTNCNGLRQCGAGWGSLMCTVPPYAGPLLAGAADVTLEVTINGQDFSRTGRSFRYYDPAAWRVRSFAPRGGPLTGNTSMRLDTELLQPLGDVRCRFGDYPLTSESNATIQDPSVTLCVSPAHWERREGEQHAELQVTLNGQDYLRFGPQARQFTYYALDDAAKGLSVLHLSPNGGPTAGGTLLRLTGTGFADVGGLWCQFEHATMPATLQDASTLFCLSPSSVAPSAFDGQPVEVTINDQLHARTNSGVAFHFFQPQHVRVSRVYPMGGPGAGGTVVTVYGRGFRDLDHGAGLQCEFGGPLVPATVAASSSEDRLTCVTPPVETGSSESHTICPAGQGMRPSVPVRLTLNGNNSAAGAGMTSGDDATFTYL